MMKAIRKTYGLTDASFFGVTSPVQTSSTVAIGISKARPNTRISDVTRLRYSRTSGISSKAVLLVASMAVNWKISGPTTKKANAPPR